jgi:hypothetical protein
MNIWLMVILLLVVGYIIGRKFPQIGAPLGL